MSTTRRSAEATAALTRRLGQFAVGTFAGACALFAPRDSVARAVDLKRRSQGNVAPKLIKAP